MQPRQYSPKELYEMLERSDKREFTSVFFNALLNPKLHADSDMTLKNFDCDNFLAALRDINDPFIETNVLFHAISRSTFLGSYIATSKLRLGLFGRYQRSVIAEYMNKNTNRLSAKLSVHTINEMRKSSTYFAVLDEPELYKFLQNKLYAIDGILFNLHTMREYDSLVGYMQNEFESIKKAEPDKTITYLIEILRCPLGAKFANRLWNREVISIDDYALSAIRVRSEGIIHDIYPIYAIGYFMTGSFEEARAECANFLRKEYLDIPFKLEERFLELYISDKLEPIDNAKPVDLEYFFNKNAVRSRSKFFINALLQALISNTFLGSIAADRIQVIKKIESFFADLNDAQIENVKKNVSEVTKNALAQGAGEIAAKYVAYPRVYRFIRSIISLPVPNVGLDVHDSLQNKGL